MNEIEAVALVRDANADVFACAGDLQMHFLVGIVTVTVNDGVDHAFTGGHGNFIQVVFVKARARGCVQNESFGLVDGVEGGFELLVDVHRLPIAEVHRFLYGIASLQSVAR